MGKAWPSGRLHKCSHLIWSGAGDLAQVWVGGAGARWPGHPARGHCAWVCVLPGDLTQLGAREAGWTRDRLGSPDVPVGVGRACQRGPPRNKGQGFGTLGRALC